MATHAVIDLTMLDDAGDASDAVTAECCICLKQPAADNIFVMSCACSVTVCRPCMYAWLAKRKSSHQMGNCPICRSSVHQTTQPPAQAAQVEQATKAELDYSALVTDQAQVVHMQRENANRRRESKKLYVALVNKRLGTRSQMREIRGRRRAELSDMRRLNAMRVGYDALVETARGHLIMQLLNAP